MTTAAGPLPALAVDLRTRPAAHFTQSLLLALMSYTQAIVLSNSLLLDDNLLGLSFLIRPCGEPALPQVHCVGKAGERMFLVGYLQIARSVEGLHVPSDMHGIDERVGSALPHVYARSPTMRRTSREFS